MTRYEKYKDEDGNYHYELTLDNGNKHMVKQELGDYIYQLERKLKQNNIY